MPGALPPAVLGATAELGRVRRARRLRRLALAALAALVLLGAAGGLGVRARTVEASRGGWRLRVTYPSVARPGLAVPWTVRVERAGGFDVPVVVATDASYLALLDENGLDPDPRAATAPAGLVVWEFAPPPGGVLEIRLDARVEPGVQRGRRGTTAVLLGGEPIVSVSYRTWVRP
jgi:hypothetical protein